HYADDPLLIVVNRIACEIHKFCAVVSGAQSDFASPRMTLQIAFANLLSQHRIYDDRGESTDAVHGIDVEPGHLDECRVVMQRCSRRIGDYDSVAAGIDCRSDSPEPLFDVLALGDVLGQAAHRIDIARLVPKRESAIADPTHRPV